ncbi:hypothetical protein TI04_00090 [Achromatium sp. WMS2]|nr:hypothetical protein TI04_00090 [Achromatium sp. WMS2]
MLKTAKTLPPVAERYVDMWAFSNVHPTNIDLLQRLKTADDRQFGTNMDVCGVVSAPEDQTGNWEKSYSVGIRADTWNPDPKELKKLLRLLPKDQASQLRTRLEQHQTAAATGATTDLSSIPNLDSNSASLAKRRLVLKLFKASTERIRWLGTIEQIISREIQHSMGSKRALLSFAVILADYEYVLTINQMHRTLRPPAVYSCMFFDETEKQPRYVTIERKWTSISADFIVKADGVKIGDIDGHLISLGYNAKLKLSDPKLGKNRHFVNLLTLFAATVGYHTAMRRSVRARLRLVTDSRYNNNIDNEELRLLKNPRGRK